MRTIECVENTNWRDTPPKYENLNDNRTMEWNMAEEIKDVKNELQNLVELSEKMHTQLVNGLQHGHIKTWEDVAEMLVNWSNEIEEKVEAITDRFY